MNVCHHTPGITSTVRAPSGLVPHLQPIDVLFHAARPLVIIPFIDCIGLPPWWDSDRCMRQDILSRVWLKRKPNHAVPYRQYQHRAVTIYQVASSDLCRAPPHEIIFTRRLFFTAAGQDGEDRPERHVDIRIGGSVQRVDQYNVRSVWPMLWDEKGLLHFL